MPGLSQTYDTLREEVAYFLGYGSEKSKWDATKEKRLTAAIRDGLHKFLFNSLAPGTQKVYRWSFLRQTFPFTTVSNQYVYKLPSDFGSQEVNIQFETDQHREIKFINESWLEQKRSAAPDSFAPPRFAAVRGRQEAGVTDQGFDLLLFPTPDGAYALQMPYHVNGEMLTADTVYPRGGTPVARALMLACKSEAALHTNDDRSLEGDYQLALAAAINYDSQRVGANLGYNRDNSDAMERQYRPWSNYTVSYNGMTSDDTVGLDDL